MTREPSTALTPDPAAPAIAAPAGAEASGKGGQLASLWRAMRHLEGRRLWIGLGLLVLGTLSEGAAIITFLPVLQLVGGGNTVVDLSGVDFPGVGLLPTQLPLAALLEEPGFRREAEAALADAMGRAARNGGLQAHLSRLFEEGGCPVEAELACATAVELLPHDMALRQRLESLREG